MKYTQKQLKEWGFKKNQVPPEDNDGVNTYTYYTFDFDDKNYGLSLISDAFEKGVKEVGVQMFEGNKDLSQEFIESVIKEFKK